MTSWIDEYEKWGDKAKEAFSRYCTMFKKDEGRTFRKIETLLKTNYQIKNDIKDPDAKIQRAIELLVGRAGGDNNRSSSSDWKNTIEETAETIVNNNHIITSFKTNNTPQRVYIWDGQYYALEYEKTYQILNKLIYEEIREEAVQPTINSIIARVIVKTLDEKGEFHKYQHLTALKNKVFNASTLEFEDLSPTKIIRHRIPVVYNPDLGFKEWQEIVDSWVPIQSHRDTLQEYVGYIWQPLFPAKKILDIYGPRHSGKSIFIQAISSLLGGLDYGNYAVLQPKDLGNRFDASALYNTIANIRSDVGDIEKVGNLEDLKPWTGDDELKAEIKGLPIFFMKIRSKIIWTNNHAPNISDKYLDNDSWVNRWLPISFPYQFLLEKEYETMKNKSDKYKLAEPSTTFGRKLTSSNMRSQIFNWSVEGLRRLKDNGWTFSYNPSYNEIVQWFKDNVNLNDVERFLKEMTKKSPKDFLSKEAVYNMYVAWASQNDIAPRIYEDFCAIVKNDNRVIPVRDYMHKDLNTKKQIAHWRGITWK